MTLAAGFGGSSTSSLTKVGAGTLVLSGINSYTGGTTVSAGKLVINGSIGSVAVSSGAVVLDASVAGIGGCPFAPRATGNICTDDLVYMLHGEGILTGIDLDALLVISEWLEGVLERSLVGLDYKAGAFAPVSAAA